MLTEADREWGEREKTVEKEGEKGGRRGRGRERKSKRRRVEGGNEIMSRLKQGDKGNAKKEEERKRWE